MRPRRIILSTLALGLVVTTVPAMAAPKPACKLMTDDEGDGRATAAPVVTSPALDIVSGDVGTGKNNLIVALRLKSTNTNGDTWATAAGYKWTINFIVQGTKYSLSRSRRSGVTPTYSDSFSAAGDTVTTWDSSKTTMDGTTITWTVPKKLVPGLLKPKAVITDLAASTSFYTNNADAAASTAKYPDLYPSCLKVS